MFHELIKYLAYTVCDIFPIGAASHLKLANYYFSYSSISQDDVLLCMLSITIGIVTCFIADICKMLKELLRVFWLLLLGRGTLKQMCSEYKHLNMLIIILAISLFYYPSILLREYIGVNYYLIGALLLISAFVLRISETFAYIKIDGRVMGYKDTAFLIVLQILSAQTGASRMALMMGGAKFLGVEKKHLIKFTFLSLIPVLIMELAFNLEDISTLYYIVTGNLNIFIIVLVSSFILVATAKRVFAMQEFYKFYYYLAGLGIWTILDILFGKR